MPRKSATPEARPTVKAFINELERLDGSRTTREKFHDLLELAYCAWAKPTAESIERADALEARYMGIVNRYEDKDTIRAYAPLIEMAMRGVIENSGNRTGGEKSPDFLGETAAQISALNEDMGQFFTPYEVSRMMAEMTLEGAAAIIADKGYITVSEPAAGSGGMILAFADALEAQGFDPTTQMIVQAVDLNAQAYYMCFLQLSWRGIPAAVIRGNTLTLETFESAWTIPIVPFVEIHGGRLFEQTTPEVARANIDQRNPEGQRAALIAALQNAHQAAAQSIAAAHELQSRMKQLELF